MGQSIGIFSGKKIFSPKNITAEITDAGNKIHFIVIKYMIGDYFLAPINKQIYAFKMDGTRIKTSDAGGTRTFSVIHYDVAHYLPISPSDLKLLEITLNENFLPKVDNRLLNILQIFGKREKESKGNFVQHDIGELIEKLAVHEERYSQEISELINFMASLEKQYIVTPVKRITDFLQGDLKTIDAKFMGEIFTQAVKMDENAKKVLNPPLNAKKSWLVLIMAIGMVILLIGLLYFANESGAFSSVGGMIPSIGGGGYDEKSLMSKYPTGPALRLAVDSGQLDYTKLPKSVQKIVDGTPSPIPLPVTP